MPEVSQVTSAQAVDVYGLIRKLKHKSRVNGQRATKRAAKDAVRQANEKIGVLHYVTVRTGVLPYNTNRQTMYRIPAGSRCLAEKVERWNGVWWMLYPISATQYDNIEDVQAKVRPIRCNRSEIKMSDEPVRFRDAEKVLLRKMFKGDRPANPVQIAALAATWKD